MNHVVAFASIALLSLPTAAPTAAPARAETGAVTLAPKTSAELTTGLSPLWLRKADLAAVDVETTATGVRARLTWRADKTGPSSILVPVGRAKLTDAKNSIQKLATTGHPPTQAEAEQLFKLLASD